MTMKRYNPNLKTNNDSFYIQSHGLNAGKPLKEPIPNSWHVETKVSNAFEICFIVYNSKFLKNYLRGSVIPFLSLREYRKIIKPLFDNPIQANELICKKLKAIALLDKAIESERKKQLYYKEMKVVIANDLLNIFMPK